MSHTKLVHSFIGDSAELFSTKHALYTQGKWHTYGDLNNKANQLANLLIKRGLQKGDRVALLLENSMEYVASYYAILKAGGITVALNTENTADDIAYIVQDCGVRYIATNPRLLTKIMSILPKQVAETRERPEFSPEMVYVWSDAGLPGPLDIRKDILLLPSAMMDELATPPEARLIDLDIASIVYTSGSTGKPRGAVLSHLNIVANTRSIADYLGLCHADRIMAVLPFYYIYGKSLLNTHFFAGGSVVIDNRFLYPNVILQTMKEQEVTGFAGVP